MNFNPPLLRPPSQNVSPKKDLHTIWPDGEQTVRIAGYFPETTFPSGS